MFKNKMRHTAIKKNAKKCSLLKWQITKPTGAWQELSAYQQEFVKNNSQFLCLCFCSAEVAITQRILYPALIVPLIVPVILDLPMRTR